MKIVYKVFAWNRKAMAWDYQDDGKEPMLFDGGNFTDLEEAKKYARECAEKYPSDLCKVDLSKYEFPDEGGDGDYIEDIEYEEP